MLTHEPQSRRQRDVAYLIEQDRTVAEIADALGLSVAAVRMHVAALCCNSDRSPGITAAA